MAPNYQMAKSQVAKNISIGLKKFEIARKYSKLPENIINCQKIYQHSEALKTIPKLEFLVRKLTIWQPWCRRMLFYVEASRCQSKIEINVKLMK
jgi:hypothetical protein